MKSEDQNKHDAFLDNMNQSGGEEVFNKLLASKKVIERNKMVVSFSSGLSQLPIPSAEELTTTVVKANNTSQEQLSTIKKETRKREKSKTSIPLKQVPKRTTVDKEIPAIKNDPVKVQAVKKEQPQQMTSQPTTSAFVSARETKMPTFKTTQLFNNTQNQQTTVPLQEEKNKVTTPLLTNSQSFFNEFKKMPTFGTSHLFTKLQTQQPTTPLPAKRNPAEQNKSSQQLPPPSQQPTEKMKSIDESTSSHINGGRAAQHVTDSPYTAEPVSKEGKNLIPRSQEIHDILSYVPSWMVRWGNTVILLILGGILVMCYYIKYPDVVPGVVNINSTYPPVSLVAKSTGAVTLFKEDKATVLAEEPIGVIKSTATYKDVITLKTVLIDFQEKIDEGASFSSYELPKKLRLGDLQSSYNQLFLKLKEQKIQYQSTKNNVKRKGNINQQLVELRAIQKAKEQSLSIKYQEYLKAKGLLETRHRILYEKGSISTEQLNAKESEVRNLLDLYQNDRMSFNEIKKRILDLDSNKAELDFQKEDQQILRQSSLMAAYEELKAAIESWEKMYVLKAPIAGTLNFIKFTKNDMYLQQEQLLANIIPTKDMQDEDISMIGELIIPSVGAGKTAIGQEVNVELNDYPKKQYGVILGKVESIDNVTVSIPDASGMAGYKVMISFPNGLESTLKKELNFKHNMQGKAEIITEDIRLLERFFHELRELADAD